LLTHGLNLTSIQPYDMFPQTEHVEVVAKFSRGN
jgi:tRNA/tmRNA/rRNA uracil-C5-methylase (TrmA/RlmC/RlmD family)